MDPANFDKRCKKINKIERKNNNYQIKVSNDSLQRNPGIQLCQRHTRTHPTKNDILRCYLLLMIISMKKKERSHFFISINIPDQRIQQFDWSRDKTGHTQSKLAVPDAILP